MTFGADAGHLEPGAGSKGADVGLEKTMATLLTHRARSGADWPDCLVKSLGNACL